MQTNKSRPNESVITEQHKKSVECVHVVLTVHVPLMLILNKAVAPRLAIVTGVDERDLRAGGNEIYNFTI